jgi:C4-dicarboxylate-specific signal transduction histidine kinase
VPAAESDAAPVVPALRAALAQVARRFPAVRLEMGAVSRGAERVEVELKDGAGGLEQLIAELVKNACEGSGTQRARRVTVSVDAESDPGSVAIRVLDDGPGFAPHVLASTPTAFVTTKPGGTGLGLYTAERLAAANGGSLQLENPPGGGSAVTLRLRRL